MQVRSRVLQLQARSGKRTCTGHSRRKAASLPRLLSGGARPTPSRLPARPRQSPLHSLHSPPARQKLCTHLLLIIRAPLAFLLLFRLLLGCSRSPHASCAAPAGRRAKQLQKERGGPGGRLGGWAPRWCSCLPRHAATQRCAASHPDCRACPARTFEEGWSPGLWQAAGPPCAFGSIRAPSRSQAV